MRDEFELDGKALNELSDDELTELEEETAEETDEEEEEEEEAV
jgi:hypothetical protein